ERRLEEQVGIESEDRKGQLVFLGKMHHDQSCALKTRANGCPRSEVFPSPAQDFFCGQLVKLLIQHSNFFRGVKDRNRSLQHRNRGAGVEKPSRVSINSEPGPPRSTEFGRKNPRSVRRSIALESSG